MKKEIKLIAFDLDGTVLDRGRDITDATAQALTKAHGHGCVLAVATGRGTDSIPPGIMNHPAVDYIISANGGVLSERASGKVLSVCGIKREIVYDIIKTAHKHGAGMEVFFADKSYYELRCLRAMIRYSRIMMSEGNNAWREMDSFLEFIRAINIILSARRLVKRRSDAVVKLVALFKKREAFERALDNFVAGGRVEAASTMGTDLEITAKNVTKGGTIAMLCEMLDIEKDAVIAFGDSGNDLSMREFVGTFIAMGNAGDDVKAVADRIAPSVSDDGVASMLHEIFGW